MKLLACDLETGTYAKGNPYSKQAYVAYVGLYDGDKYSLFDIAYSDSPYGEALKSIQDSIDEADMLLFVNGKFDIAHLRNLGITVDHKRIWDCQLVKFILSNQSHAYPSLNDMLEEYGFELKDDRVKEYWDAGVDTNAIPQDILEEYLKYDLLGTYNVALKQMEQVDKLPQNRQRLISLCNQDLLVLQEIEWNGVKYDTNRSKELADELTLRLEEIDRELYDYHNIEEFNANSGDHLSVLLYGGTITIPRKVLVGQYKTGERTGQDKFGWQDFVYDLPQLVKPLKNTLLKKSKGEDNKPDTSKPQYYGTGEDVLRSLKTRGIAKKLVDLILERSKLEKLVGTYYKGLPELIEKMDWEEDTIHSTFNQCQARTGRLSSSRANMQNIVAEAKMLFPSRWN
jgi:DNA polymerase I-like protein with 3'-5' exonuclease and polymerase domains